MGADGGLRVFSEEIPESLVGYLRVIVHLFLLLLLRVLHALLLRLFQIEVLLRYCDVSSGGSFCFVSCMLFSCACFKLKFFSDIAMFLLVALSAASSSKDLMSCSTRFKSYNRSASFCCWMAFCFSFSCCIAHSLLCSCCIFSRLLEDRSSPWNFCMEDKVHRGSSSDTLAG